MPLAVVALLAAATAHATTFSGTCQLSGTVMYSPAITIVPHTGLDVAWGTGTCSGALITNRRHRRILSSAPVTIRERHHGLIWCMGGASTGTGVLDFTYSRIDFQLAEQRGPGIAVLELTGARGGRALGTAAVDPRSAESAAQQCAGSGLTTAPISWTIASPSISG
jgi:hypothetical protein